MYCNCCFRELGKVFSEYFREIIINLKIVELIIFEVCGDVIM